MRCPVFSAYNRNRELVQEIQGFRGVGQKGLGWEERVLRVSGNCATDSRDMGSDTPHKLPTFNLSSKAAEGTSSEDPSCHDVRKAMEEYGCFVVEYDGVSLDLHNKVFGVLDDLFRLPNEVKAKNTSPKPYHGYRGGTPPPFPSPESFGIENPNILDEARRFSNLMWPKGNDQFCESIHLYSKQIAELERLVKRMIFQSYGVENYVQTQIDSTSYLLRINRYEPSGEKNEANLGAFPHCDKTFITILHQNQVDGLEVQTKDGEWIKYEPVGHSFVVMAGEAFLAWSNNRIPAPLHQVMMKGDKIRYSLGTFTFINGDVEVPQELVDDQHPLQFRPFNHYGLLHFYTKEENQSCSIKAYCGI